MGWNEGTQSSVEEVVATDEFSEDMYRGWGYEKPCTIDELVDSEWITELLEDF